MMERKEKRGGRAFLHFFFYNTDISELPLSAYSRKSIETHSSSTGYMSVNVAAKCGKMWASMRAQAARHVLILRTGSQTIAQLGWKTAELATLLMANDQRRRVSAVTT